MRLLRFLGIGLALERESEDSIVAQPVGTGFAVESRRAADQGEPVECMQLGW